MKAEAVRTITELAFKTPEVFERSEVKWGNSTSFSFFLEYKRGNLAKGHVNNLTFEMN